MTHIPSSLPDDDALDDDRFDEVIESMLHGDRSGIRKLDPEMGSTIDQLFGWADQSGFADEPPSLISFVDRTPIGMPSDPQPQSARGNAGMASQTPSPNSDQHRLHVAPRRKRPHPLVAIVSSIAALLLIGLAVYGVRPFVVGQDQKDAPTTIAFAAHDATAETTAMPSPSPTPYPTIRPNPSVAYAVPPLSATECTAAPRSRKDLLAILSTPPAPENLNYYGNLVADQQTVDEMNTLLRNWESCGAFGMTWEQTAYESKQFIREKVYGNPQITSAFSVSTLNELLDARAATDAESVAQRPSEWDIVTIDPTSTVWITPESGPILTVRADVIVVSTQTGEIESGPYRMAFVYEDGSWKIRWAQPGSLSFLSS